jgi:hypothetical protein
MTICRKSRACLCCGKQFVSEGAHNRLCFRCRASNRAMSRYDIPATLTNRRPA